MVGLRHVTLARARLLSPFPPACLSHRPGHWWHACVRMPMRGLSLPAGAGAGGGPADDARAAAVRARARRDARVMRMAGVGGQARRRETGMCLRGEAFAGGGGCRARCEKCVGQQKTEGGC